jgi:hypothetical protein
MNFFRKIGSLAGATAASLVAVHSANAAVQVTFDAVDSNIAGGLYAFDLSGIPSANPVTYNSSFEMEFWDLLSPSPGNTATLTSSAAPSGWSYFLPGSTATSEWYFENTSGASNGTFIVKASPNLHGTLDWNFTDSGNAENISGTVTIAAVPEPALYGVFGGAAGLLGAILVPICRRFRSHPAVA